LLRRRVHRIPPRVRDDREPPLQWDGTGQVRKGDLPDGKSGKFFARGLDKGKSGHELICPSGKSPLRDCTPPYLWTDAKPAGGSSVTRKLSRDDCLAGLGLEGFANLRFRRNGN
jgi:hypothetical protein